jgi:hypothetical protein
MRQKLRRGEFPGKPPVGYMNEPRLRTIIVEEHKAQLVRRMFETYATGRHTFDDLHELVTGWGLTSHREKPIARSMLPRLLANPFYVGLFRFADETHDGTHQPLVSKALFDEAQNVMARRGRPHKPRRKPLSYIGSIQCGACGAAITGERQKGRHYYRCTRKLGPCSQKRFIREETLTDEFRHKTATGCIPQVPGQSMLAQFAEWRRAEADSRSEQLAGAKERLAAIESRLSRLLDVYIDGTIDHDDYARKKEELLHDKAAIKEAIGRIQSEGNAWRTYGGLPERRNSGGKHCFDRHARRIGRFSPANRLEPILDRTGAPGRRNGPGDAGLQRTCGRGCGSSRRLRRT